MKYAGRPIVWPAQRPEHGASCQRKRRRGQVVSRDRGPAVDGGFTTDVTSTMLSKFAAKRFEVAGLSDLNADALWRLETDEMALSVHRHAARSFEVES